VVVGRIFRRLTQLRLGSLNRGDYAVEDESSVEKDAAAENAEAGAAAASAHRGTDLDSVGIAGASYPPNYVRQDDGRPRH
jgi:hypothetical protein